MFQSHTYSQSIGNKVVNGFENGISKIAPGSHRYILWGSCKKWGLFKNDMKHHLSKAEKKKNLCRIFQNPNDSPESKPIIQFHYSDFIYDCYFRDKLKKKSFLFGSKL